MSRSDHYERNLYMREWARKRRRAFFADKHCAHCGSTGNLVLHHIDPATKITSVIWAWGDEKRLAEIAKCIVLCDHCHRVLHNAMRRTPLVHGTRNAYNNRGCRCDACKEWRKEYGRDYRARKKAEEASPRPIPVQLPVWEMVGE